MWVRIPPRAWRRALPDARRDPNGDGVGATTSSLPRVLAVDLRSQFPVCRRLAYLNAGTCGPLPTAAARAASEQLEREVGEGRARAHFERRAELAGAMRDAYARVLAADDPREVALTNSTTDGIVRVLAGLGLGAGDEVVTSEEEHPGLLGPLARLRRRGVKVRAAALADVPDAVGPGTRLVACSHVSWITGETAPAALAELDRPVLLDGAQGAGAIPVDVGPRLRERLDVLGAGYSTLADPGAGLDADLWPDCRALDAPAIAPASAAAALAAARVLADAGWDEVHRRAACLAARLADALRERGRAVRPRDQTTLVAFESADAEAEASELAGAGVVVRFLPGRGLLRASVGAWNDEEDLERLLAALRV
jgi:selenocysteine lyase/cysteine desulfurase